MGKRKRSLNDTLSVRIIWSMTLTNVLEVYKNSSLYLRNYCIVQEGRLSKELTSQWVNPLVNKNFPARKWTNAASQDNGFSLSSSPDIESQLDVYILNYLLTQKLWVNSSFPAISRITSIWKSWGSQLSKLIDITPTQWGFYKTELPTRNTVNSTTASHWAMRKNLVLHQVKNFAGANRCVGHSSASWTRKHALQPAEQVSSVK